jgi:hypothetical protein
MGQPLSRSKRRARRSKLEADRRSRLPLHTMCADTRNRVVEGELRKSVPQNRQTASRPLGPCADCGCKIEPGETVKRNLRGSWVHVGC